MGSSVTDQARPLCPIDRTLLRDTRRAPVDGGGQGRPKGPRRWRLVLGGGGLVLILLMVGGWYAFSAGPPSAGGLGDKDRELLERTAQAVARTDTAVKEMTAQLRKVEQRLENIKPVNSTLGGSEDKLAKQVKEIKSQIEKVQTLSEDLQKTTGELNKEMTKLTRAKIDDKLIKTAIDTATGKAVETVRAEVKGVSGELKSAVKKEVDKTSVDVADIVDRKLTGPLKNLRGEIDELTQGLARLTEQLKRESDRQDVALVLSHCAKLNANKYLSPVKKLVDLTPRKSYPKYDLGVYAISGDEIVPKWGRPLTAKRKTSTKPVADSFEPFPPNSRSLEQFEKLKPADVFGPGAAKPGQRRAVFVVSTGSKPPDPEVKPWQDVVVDAVLIDVPGQAESEKNQARWRDFCRDHGGVAVTLKALGKGGDYTIDAKKLEHYLRRLIAPQCGRPSLN